MTTRYTPLRKRAFCFILTGLLIAAPGDVEGKIPPFFSKRKKKVETTDTRTGFERLTGRTSAEDGKAMNVIQKGDTFYLEIPTRHLGREFLVTNKLQRVPEEMNEAGVNRGVNYESQVVRFEWDKSGKRVMLRQQRLTPEAPAGSAIARSVQDNYLDPLIAALKVEYVADDSSSVVFKANVLFDGKENCLNDVFNKTNIGTSPKSDLSRILSLNAFEQSVVGVSELTTVVHEGNEKAYVTVVVSSALTLLPERLMERREEDWRVGFFTTGRTHYDDVQQAVKRKNYITRWRLEPSDTVAYMRGVLTRPKKPIVFYIDQAVPARLRPYIRQGITDWNKAFERAGFRDAVMVADVTDSIAAEGDDLKYSVLTYDASEKANAMGPSVIDPRTGEILEADIIWWHNVLSLVREWIMVQTAATNPAARTLELPEELIGDAVRFVACHEVGHSLGLRHNMIASAAYPTDSLRSPAFMERVGGTSASIMDYARFNYVAQPGDGVRVMSPHIGPYDLMAVEWAYRWYPAGANVKAELEAFLARHQGDEFRYSEAQDMRTAVDPRALSEDLGDDAVKSARYGIANLKRIVPNVVDWTRTEEHGQTYEEAAKFYSAIISQWGLYLYHALANIGGMYLERATVDNGLRAFTFVEKARQREALQFLLDEVLCYPEWLFGTPLARQVYLLRNTPLGVTEQEPNFLLKNQQNYILWDLLANERLIRMYENEFLNGGAAFTAVEMMDMLHRHIFKKTIAGQSPDVMERSLQKSFVDALITAAAESEGVKINKRLADESLSTGRRTIEHTSGQVSRNSDAISVKRGELLRILQLMKSRVGGDSGDLAAQMHYADVALRIQTALGLQKEAP